MAEGGPLGLAADQADVGQIGLGPLAFQAGGHHVQVFGMAETHDQHKRAACQVRDRRLDRFGMLAHHVARHVGRKDLVAAVDPGHGKRQRRQRIHQGASHVAAAEQGQGPAAARQLGPQRRDIGRTHPPVAQHHHAPAALAQGRTEGIAAGQIAGAGFRQQRPGLGDGLVLQLAAADGAHHRIGEHGHPGAGFARRRALGGGHLDQHRVVAGQPAREIIHGKGLCQGARKRILP